MGLRRCLALGALAVLAGLLLSSCVASSGPPAESEASTGSATEPESARSSSANRTAAATTVHHSFAPYDASGQLTVQVGKSKRTGTCWTTSIAIPIAGVYRCFAANEILDPCFAPAVETSPPTVACFLDPWHRGTLLTLRGALPKDDPTLADGRPWAVQLANSAHCVDITGAVPTVDGVAVGYACGSRAVAGLAAGGASGALIARYGSMHGPLHTEQVVAEWRGRSYRISSGD